MFNFYETVKMKLQKSLRFPLFDIYIHFRFGDFIISNGYLDLKIHLVVCLFWL